MAIRYINEGTLCGMLYYITPYLSVFFGAAFSGKCGNLYSAPPQKKRSGFPVQHPGLNIIHSTLLCFRTSATGLEKKERIYIYPSNHCISVLSFSKNKLMEIDSVAAHSPISTKCHLFICSQIVQLPKAK